MRLEKAGKPGPKIGIERACFFVDNSSLKFYKNNLLELYMYLLDRHLREVG